LEPLHSAFNFVGGYAEKLFYEKDAVKVMMQQPMQSALRGFTQFHVVLDILEMRE
jgi:hypothetical protein